MRTERKGIMARVDPLFKKMIEQVAIDRIKKGLDRKITQEQRSIRRYTRAMTRFEPLWNALKESTFKEENL
jgi:uncharacterized protein YeeX (DUF496 family)